MPPQALTLGGLAVGLGLRLQPQLSQHRIQVLQLLLLQLLRVRNTMLTGS